MKQIFTIFAVVLLTTNVFTQSPQEMSYQAVIRNANNNLVTNQIIGMQISIIQGTPTGTTVYTETQSPTTNANGLVSIEIGNGSVVTGDFAAIDWATGTYFIKTETDPSGGTMYTITGISQLLSVPYALYAQKAKEVDLTTEQINILKGNQGINGKDGLTTTVNGVVQIDGEITLTKTDIGLTNVDNTSDLEKPISSATQNMLNTKVDTVTGKGLSTNDYTDAEKTKLAAIIGTNTGDQDISSLATKIDLQDSIAQIRKEIPIGISDLSMNANAQIITNLGNPVNPQDAATKAYVDALLTQIIALKTQIEPFLIANGFTDSRDGNHYNVVKIGNQIWMAENLKYLPSVVEPATGSSTTPYYYVYDYNGTDVNAARATANYTTYGVLYNWTAAMNSSVSSTANPSSVQGVCPIGWHLPSDAEWTELTNYLGGTSVAGGKLKEIGTTHWSSPNTGATNATGFTALPAGDRIGSGSFLYVGLYGYWWSTTEFSATNTRYQSLSYYSGDAHLYNYGKEFGFSVRCVRD